MLLALASIQFGRLGSTFGKPKELFADAEWQNNDTASLSLMASRTNIANACIYAMAAKRPYAI
jgi:hypothetical protein